ncbi:hypothetical protein HHX38_08580 [Streptomyces sp. PKU-MA01144]|uniref:hypothetical protein n=1 Tax=Streptomyces sp. PKU-MA01144 TaxID=2729138 RepID=UPI00147D2307|nr:hypothetical protein [Streptomyces sp. PKU-MA01144]NNJ04189.1 hypothetical protein [Streptomyces sp. PKU-MA01144]
MSDHFDDEYEGPDAAEQAMAEDGFGSYARFRPAPITHPTMRATREHFKANPLPEQRRRAV